MDHEFLKAEARAFLKRVGKKQPNFEANLITAQKDGEIIHIGIPQNCKDCMIQIHIIR